MNHTPIYLDRLATALARDGIKLKRSRLLRIAAEAFGCRNVHELSSMDRKGEIDAISPAHLGTTAVLHVGDMHVFRDPSGYHYAVEASSLHGKGWHLAPLGGLSRHDVAVGACETAQSALAAIPNNAEEPYFLTDSDCTHMHGRQKDLEALGFDLGSFANDFYPLTEKEEAYVADMSIVATDRTSEARIGYAAMYKGIKHLSPTVEFPYGEEFGQSQEQALLDALKQIETLREPVEGEGGTLFLESEGHDAYGAPAILIRILIPFESAMAYGDPQSWHDRLAQILCTSSNAAPSHHEFRREGAEFAVVLEYIGEGVDGDYNPEDPDDIPLYRFSVECLVGEEWVQEDDASYCTQIRADIGSERALRAADHLLNLLQVEGGSNIKRLCERLSWTSIEDVEK